MFPSSFAVVARSPQPLLPSPSSSACFAAQYFTVKMDEGFNASSFKQDHKFYINAEKLLPASRFLNQGKTSGAPRGAGRGGARGRGAPRGRGGASRSPALAPTCHVPHLLSSFLLLASFCRLALYSCVQLLVVVAVRPAAVAARLVVVAARLAVPRVVVVTKHLVGINTEQWPRALLPSILLCKYMSSSQTIPSLSTYMHRCTSLLIILMGTRS